MVPSKSSQRRRLPSSTLVTYLLALVLLWASQMSWAATTLSPTRTPTLRPTPDPKDDPTYGTANAPTTPGGVCLNDHDYGKWTSSFGTPPKTGFDAFPSDLQKCSLTCGSLLAQDQSVPYGCGGAFQPACSNDLFSICVGDCIGDTLPSGITPPALEVKNYSEPCSACMGNLGLCGARNCTVQCIQGSFTNKACRECNELKCNSDFMVCAGLNPAIRTAAALDTTPILIGAIAGGVTLLVLAGVFGYIYRMRTRKDKMLTPEELAIIAASQSASASPVMSMQGSLAPIGSGSFRMDNPGLGGHTSNPAYQSPAKVMSGSSFGSGGSAGIQAGSVGLTPYQQQYLAQQEALAKGVFDGSRQSRMAPSQRVSAMAAAAMAAPPKNIASKATRLVVIYDFVAEREDELTASVGAKMLGIEQQEGWWLAQDERGIIGLIPASYTEVDTDPAPTTTMDPDF